MAERIKIIGTGYTRDMRIEALAVPHADDFLDDDCHLFIYHLVLCCLNVVFRVPQESRSVDKLDRLHQLPEAGVSIQLVVWDHFCGIDAGERLEHGVLEHAGRPDGQRRVNLGDKGAQVANELGRKLGLLKSSGDEVIAEAGESHVVEVVLLHEKVEELCGDDCQGRNGDVDIRPVGCCQAAFENVLHQGQAMGFSPQGTATDGRELFFPRKEMAVEGRDGLLIMQT